MNFIADLHIHSRFSMATSKDLNIENLCLWAKRKGISVLATGDFTHPGWRRELKESLIQDANTGLLRPLSNCRNGLTDQTKDIQFILGTEISCVYKRHGKTRKVHNLLFAPDFETVEKISYRLSAIGNLESDGRPVLKIDSRDLLEIALEASDKCVLVPAHIWTPWYSLFGSRSGFNVLEDCYADLSGHIFAVETGLSSDPAMNRLCGFLDGYALISNSDAHSGANLGREANIFRGEPSWEGLFGSLRRAAKRESPDSASCEFLGTLEFFPEEGKYHLDGHRSCGVSLTPTQSREYGNICPACGKPMTIGVLHRVMELADRTVVPELVNEPGYGCIIPLQLIIAQILGFGSQSAAVRRIFNGALEALGPELDILCTLETEECRSWWEPLGEAIERMRNGKVDIRAGFDGEYGKVTIFADNELEHIRKNQKLPVLTPQNQ